jgi:phosphate transport system substrate-binding protein
MKIKRLICPFAHLPICPFAYLLICLFLTACAQTPTPTVQTVSFSLVADSSTAPLLDELVAAYLAERPHVTIHVEHAPNAQRALEALQKNQYDLASLCWLPQNIKNDTSAQDGGDFWYRPFARDAIVIITHPSNPAGGLTLLQLRGIFQGQTIFWNELGGLEQDIMPVSREAGAGTRLNFETLVMGERNVTPTAVVMPSNKTVVEYVSATPGAIGYVSSGWLAPGVNLLAVEGATPSPASIQDGRYLLAWPFYLLARAEPNGGPAGFINWVHSSEGQAIVQRGYGPAP